MIAKDPKNLKMPRFFRENPSYPGNGRKWQQACAQYDEIIETTHYDKAWLNDYLGAVADAGFLIVYNHPEWSVQNSGDYLGLRHIHGIEVSNGSCIPYMDCTGIHFQQMLRSGMRVVPETGRIPTLILRIRYKERACCESNTPNFYSKYTGFPVLEEV
jgi:hypothetical protein